MLVDIDVRHFNGRRCRPKSRPTALAVIRHHKIITLVFSLLTITLTCRGLDGDGRQ